MAVGERRVGMQRRVMSAKEATVCKMSSYGERGNWKRAYCPSLSHLLQGVCRMSKTYWLIGAALMSVAAPVVAQQPSAEARVNLGVIRVEGQPGYEFQQFGPNAIFRRVEGPSAPYSTALIADPMPSKYWLGIQCGPVSPALRSHVKLPDKQGLLVMEVSRESPAAKAGFAQYDILLRAGDKALNEARDLMAAVEAAKETKMKIEFVRGGKPKTIEVAPAKRPALATAGAVQVQTPQEGDWGTIEKWLEGMTSGQAGTGPQGQFQIRAFGPGAIVPKDVLIGKPLPPNMSIAITKEGDQPAKITVKSGDKKWDVTEKELDKLPADVRPHVERMLGRGVFGIIGGAVPPIMSGGVSGSGTFTAPALPPGMQIQTFPGGLNPQMEKRFDEINRRMDELFKMMEQMKQQRGEHAAPVPHEGVK
jgi:hypothetical protein